ncbi:hypothetical protein ACKI1O_07490 [Streptomyces scabiei]
MQPLPAGGRGGPPPCGALPPSARLARPGIGPGEVLVRVHAWSVYRGISHGAAGLPERVGPVRGPHGPRLPHCGRDIAGVVEASGPP